MVPVKLMSKSLELSKPVLFGGFASGLGAILFVGLMSGLVGRPNNCIPQNTTPLTLTSTQFSTDTFTTSTLTMSTQTSTTSTTASTTVTRPVTSTTSSTSSTSRVTSSSSSTTSTQRSSSTSSSTTRTITSTTTTSSTSSSSTSSTLTTSTSTTIQTSTTQSTTSRSSSSSSSSSSTRTTTTSITLSTSSTTLLTPNNRTIPTLSTLTTSTRPLTTTEPPVIRLKNDIKPIHYDLTLKAFFEPYSNTNDIDKSKEYFEGIVKIELNVNKQTNSILLHSDRSLNITNVKLTQNTVDVQISNKNSLPYQLYEITTTQILNIGSYSLMIEFSGNYGPLSNLVGFYRSRYFEENVYKTVLSSNFEPIDARKAFPCFDEPSFKATYDVTIEHPSNSIALSNWPIKNQQTTNSRTTTSFERTYPMSTYLIAWVIAPDDYKFKSDKTTDGTEIRVYARKSAVDNGLVDFAVEVAVKVTDYFKNIYFEIDDAVPPKIDLVALPDFPAGAMEHWGVISFRETALLYSDKLNSLSNKQSVAGIIAHELAHFWFGNLVTCAWWDDLWLNEAMATFLQYKSMSKVYPEFDLQDQFLSNTLIPVMYDDGYSASSPVTVEVNDPNLIGSLFSSITYDKGSSVLTMLEATVNETNFRDGLRNYLTVNKFQSGVANDFYETLNLPSEMNGVTVKEYIETWLLQINYPEIDVIVDKSAADKTKVNFVQGRFLLSIFDEDFLDDAISPFNYTWKIYLQCKAGNLNSVDTKDFQYYLDTIRGSIELDAKYDWIKCNKDFKGFYVTNYNKENFENLIQVLKDKPELFSIGDRTNLIHVAYSLAYKGSISYNIPAFLSSYLETQEKDYVPWRTFIWHMNKLSQILEHRNVFYELRRYGISLAKPLSNNLDIWSDTGSHTQRLLKSNLIEFLCRLQDPHCLYNITSYWESIPQEYFNSPVDNFDKNPVPVNYKASVYRFHTQNTYDYQDWFRLNNLYLTTIDPQERASVISGLSYTRLLWLVDLYLDELLVEKSRIKPQDFFDVISLIGRNPSGRHVAWTFVRDNWFQIVTKFGNSRAFNRAIKNICESFDNTFLLQEVLVLFNQTPNGAGQLIRAQTIEIILNNIFWVNDREADLNQAFFTPTN